MSLVKKEYESLKSCVAGLGSILEDIELTGDVLLERLRTGKTVYACGNGGSATDSMHLCEELIGYYRGKRRPFPAISLNADCSAITCIGNDDGFDSIFSRQIEALGGAGDILVGFSTSGNSENIAHAFEAACKNGVTTILVSGNAGGKIKAISDFSIVVPNSNTARIQEMHTFILHAWLEVIENQDW